MHDLNEVQAVLSQGQLARAQAMLGEVLDTTPDDPDALYLQAVVYRFASEHRQALGVLEQLKKIAPMHSRAHQEEGHIYRDLGEKRSALTAYGRALTLNPSLDACLRASIDLHQSIGQEFEANALGFQLEQLQALPKPLKAVIELVSTNKLLKAEAVCRRFLAHNPKHIQGMRLLADIGSRLGVLDDAEFLLESAAAFAPDDLQTQLEYVQVLRKRQKFAKALSQAQKLLVAHPDNPQVKSLCAIEHMQTGDYDAAIALLDDVLLQIPNDARTMVTYGHALKTSGHSAKAIQMYRSAIESQPEHGEAYYSLANLKVYRFESGAIERMKLLESGGNLGFMDRIYLNFALAKAHEDQAQYDSAFGYYAQGNALKKAQSRYDAQAMTDELAKTQATCDQQFFESRAPAEFGSGSADPIFIVGLPRAGSTLLEQILSSHSQVDGTLELPNILSLSQQLRRRKSGLGYPETLHELTAAECSAYGDAYLRDTQIHRSGAPFFIDKMPNNFRHIGLIRLILPNAKIIDARREPMACCFSAFKQLFAEGQEFTYDLEDVGRYYSDYVDLMTHWNEVLPDFVLRVQHEDVVDNVEREVRRILEFCELPFEESCVRFFETERNIRTPSSEQVRQPIFTDSLEQWRNFDAYLEPLKGALGLLHKKGG